MAVLETRSRQVFSPVNGRHRIGGREVRSTAEIDPALAINSTGRRTPAIDARHGPA
jgi:hypothetical protein